MTTATMTRAQRRERNARDLRQLMDDDRERIYTYRELAELLGCSEDEVHIGLRRIKRAGFKFQDVWGVGVRGRVVR